MGKVILWGRVSHVRVMMVVFWWLVMAAVQRYDGGFTVEGRLNLRCKGNYKYYCGGG